MIWAHLVWNEKAAPILRQLDQRGRAALPSEQAVLDERPESDAAIDIALKAWRAVSSERAIGMGIGPVPQSAIDAWCDRHIDDSIAADFLGEALRYVDGKVLDREADKQRTS